MAFDDARGAESGETVYLFVYLRQVHFACPNFAGKRARGIIKILYFGSIGRIYKTGLDVISVAVLKNEERVSNSSPFTLKSSKFSLVNSVSLHLPICVAFEGEWYIINIPDASGMTSTQSLTLTQDGNRTG